MQGWAKQQSEDSEKINKNKIKTRIKLAKKHRAQGNRKKHMKMGNTQEENAYQRGRKTNWYGRYGRHGLCTHKGQYKDRWEYVRGRSRLSQKWGRGGQKVKDLKRYKK